MHSVFSPKCAESTNILGKAGSAERIARSQVVRRDVEFGVRQEDACHVCRVDGGGECQSRDFIGKRNFECVK